MKPAVAAKSDPNAFYLIDSSIYVFRAWHSMPASITDADDHPANATFGFIEFLYQLISRRNPELIACAFDESLGTSVRNEIYPDYKANRSPAPDELKHQFELCKAFTEAIGITALASGQLEADDIIGSLAEIAQQQKIHTVIVSADKDLCQFVGDGDAIWDFARDTWLDARLIEKRFGVRPHQIADSLALTGDKVDNIPGIPGVGTATAARLLVKWGNLTALLDNTDKVPAMKFRGASRVAELLQDHAETVLLARQLTGLIPATTLNTTLSEYRIQPDEARMESVFDQLGFNDRRRQRWHSLLEKSAVNA